jgi:hypothetical protein
VHVAADTVGSAQAPGALHGPVPVHGHVPHAVAGMIARRRGTPAPVSHSVAISRDEGHSHTMVTRRSADVTLKPAERLNLSATTSTVISPIPADYHSALANPYWRATMQEEFQALIDNDTWTLVPCPPPPVPTLCPANGFSSTSFIQMVLSHAIKHVG